jgi:hypothetical protein
VVESSWSFVGCSREESRKEGVKLEMASAERIGRWEAGSYNLRSVGRPPPPRSIFPHCIACLPVWLSSCAPPLSPTSTTTVPSHTACPPAFGRLTPRSASSLGSDSHTREPKGCEHTHSRTRPPAVPAAQGVEGHHTTSKSCGSHLQIESPPPRPSDPPPHRRATPLRDVGGWVDGWRLCTVSSSLPDYRPGWL